MWYKFKYMKKQTQKNPKWTIILLNRIKETSVIDFDFVVS